MIEFESLQTVDPREYWRHEAHDFTPWLAEHIDLLGKAVGLELELVEREAQVGNFSLDLLATDLGQNAPVIIENQLEVTDHDHLGKLLTYASGYDANVVIWVATDIREEHRQALDWLNQRTDSETDFFAVAIEVVRIGDSKPALQFKVVVSPNEWQKSTKTRSSSGLSEKSEKYLNYFQTLIDDLRENHRFTGAKKGQPQNWFTFSSGSSKFVYGHSFAAGNRVRVEVYIDNGDMGQNKNLFDRLFERKDEIEQRLGSELEWERLDDKRACRVALYREGNIECSNEEVEVIRGWAVDNLLKFKEVFGSITSLLT